MSQCFRSVSNKLTPFAGTRKQVTHLERQLPKHIKSSFLDKFLGTRNVLNTSIALKDSPNEAFQLYFSFQNQSISSLKVFKGNPSILFKPNSLDDKVINFNGFKELQRGSVTLLGLKPVDVFLEDNSTNNRQKFFTKKQLSKDAQEVLIKISPFTMKDHIINQMIPPDIENPVKLLMNERLNLQTENKNEVSPNTTGRPTQEQLENVYNNLKNELPHLFTRPIDYSIYREDLIFVNNIRGTTTIGMFNYVKQLMWLRAIGHIKFACVKFEMLKITIHPEEDAIKIRWRIRGTPGFKIFATFWKLKSLKINEALNDHETWYDGFSTFYVESDGKVIKHVADKMMPDQDTVIPKRKLDVAAKLAASMFLGIENLKQIFPGASCEISNLSNLLYQRYKRRNIQKEPC